MTPSGRTKKLALTGLLLAILGPRAVLWLLAAVVMGAVVVAVLTGMKTRLAGATPGAPMTG